MNEVIFPDFHATYPPHKERVQFDPARHEKFAKLVPPLLAKEWRQFGFGAYGKGFLWTVVPDEPILNPDEWSCLDGTGIEVLRTAFGDVCLWQNKQFLWLNIHSNKSTNYNTDEKTIFHIVLLWKDFRKFCLWEPLFKKAYKKFGQLNIDECYGFAPLPALGGDISEEYLIKTKMREYVAMLGQLHN